MPGGLHGEQSKTGQTERVDAASQTAGAVRAQHGEQPQDGKADGEQGVVESVLPDGRLEEVQQTFLAVFGDDQVPGLGEIL